MFNINNETTLISQLFDSIYKHLKTIGLSMDEQNFHECRTTTDDDDLSISDHRSIFSSIGNDYQNFLSSFHTSQYEGFHWDLYENHDYHYLAFGHKDNDDSQQSINFTKENVTTPLPLRTSTSWQEIKVKSMNVLPQNDYHHFQETTSQQHPCRLYKNFSNNTSCDSLSFHTARTNEKPQTLLCNIKLTQELLKSYVDQCLQTSTVLSTKDNVINVNSNLPQSQRSLPNLDFLTYYAKETRATLSTVTSHTKQSSSAMKCTLSKPLSSRQKAKYTIFFMTIKNPVAISKTPTTEEAETFSSTCSSTSSSGYFSNSSSNQTHQIQTYPLPYPLKSCLKQTKVHDSTHETKIKCDRSVQLKAEHTSKSSMREQTFRTDRDFHTKKNVSFCDEIVRRLITPSTNSSNDIHQDYSDLTSRDYLTDSPPNEFNLSDDEENVINVIETAIINQHDKCLIDAFANAILHILEIKCNDPKSVYLNNQTNHELDRVLRQDLCPMLREILQDGLRQYSGSLFSRKINLWRLIELTTTTENQFYEAKAKALCDMSSSVDWTERFNAFIYHLLNFRQLTSWVTYFISNRSLLTNYYEPSAFILINTDNHLFECLTNQLEKLSPLQFRLKYRILFNPKLSPQEGTKKFNIRTWLRERKVQIKPSTTKSITSVLSNVSIRRKSSAIPTSK